MDKLYKCSKDYAFAEVLLREGKTLAAWLTDTKGNTAFSLIKFNVDEFIDGNLEENLENSPSIRDFNEYCERNDALFLLPVSDNSRFDQELIKYLESKSYCVI